ncbi:MAG: mandelate racemase/muconate lactonizing enzyme family protein [Burkholderiales bacterium]
MTIRSVEAIPIALPFEIGGPKPMLAGKPRTMDILLVRIETTDGQVGWGEAFGFAVWPATKVALETLVAPLAVGRDERDIEGVTNDIQRKLHLLGRTGPVMYAISGLDIALWDLAGKAAGKSLAAILANSPRKSLPAYASLLRYTDPALVARHAARAVEEGYTTIKLHEIGVEQVRAAREAIGPAIKLTMDTNCLWTVDEAIAMARQLQPYALTWFEEPVFPPEDFVGLARVRREGGLPIAAGENAVSAANFAQMFDAGAVDFAQPSVTKIGGVSEMMRIVQLAHDRGVTLVPHSPYFGPGLLATVHIAAAMEAETMIEYSFADLGGNPLGDAISVRDGRVAVPTGPGLGRDPDPGIIERYRAY